MEDLMRLGAPQGMKMGFGWQPRADGSVCATSIVGRRLLEGRHSPV